MSGRSAQWRPASRSQPTRARPRLCCQGGRWLALPHPRLLSKSWSRWRATFCAWGRQAPMAKFGRLADLAKVEDHKSDMCDRCFGGLPRRVNGRGAAKAMVHRRFSRSLASVRPHLICCRGLRAHLSAQACEKGRPRLRLHQSRGRARSRQLQRHNPRVKSVGLGPHAAVWPPSLGCPLGRSLPRLPMGWRGLARGLCTSPPMVVHPGCTQLSGFEVRFLVSGPREGGRPSCGGDSASR